MLKELRCNRGVTPWNPDGLHVDIHRSALKLEFASYDVESRSRNY